MDFRAPRFDCRPKQGQFAVESRPAAELSRIDPDGTVAASVTVENTADRAAHEVVQWYTHDVHPALARPVQRLRGFERVFLEPGERARISVELGASQLAFLDRDERLAVHPGEYELRVGRSAGDVRATAPFEIAGETRFLDPGEQRLFSGVSAKIGR